MPLDGKNFDIMERDRPPPTTLSWVLLCKYPNAPCVDNTDMLKIFDGNGIFSCLRFASGVELIWFG